MRHLTVRLDKLALGSGETRRGGRSGVGGGGLKAEISLRVKTLPALEEWKEFRTFEREGHTANDGASLWRLAQRVFPPRVAESRQRCESGWEWWLESKATQRVIVACGKRSVRAPHSRAP